MDVTPKAFRDVQFREKLRGGYHPEDVDEFLEQAALGVEVLIDRLQQVTERAQRAEKAASEASASDETLKRMLLMAQRTVDQAVKEANDDAERLLSKARAQADSIGAESRAQAEALVSDARAQAEALVSDAQAQAEGYLSDAEERGRAAFESHLAEGRASVEIASSALQQAQQEAEALRSWVDVNRAQLLGVLRDAEGLVANAASHVENIGLLGEPPLVGPIAAIPSQGEPTDSDAADDATAAPDAEAGLTPEIAEDDEEAGSHLLEGPRAREGLPAPPAGPADQEVEAAQGAGEPGEGAGEAPQAVAGAVGTEPPADAPMESPPGEDQSLAFDERALDSFFSEQDLGEQRTTSRFRRRQ
ncbi:MAG TPA: DivIVA domain-containing protein [Acidimicrobiales bacterium]|nr:DivIVA domain-containing protein [Acidimicrobiales bacterium]